MKNKKTIVIMLAVTALLICGFFGVKAVKDSRARAEVISVSMLDVGTMEDSMSMDGTIYDTDSQSVYLTPAQTVSAVYVTVGQQVKAGDALMAYDMTSQNIAMKLKELEVESAKKSLQTAQNELKNLKAGKTLASAGTVTGTTVASSYASATDTVEGTEEAPVSAAPAPARNGEAWTVLTETNIDDYYNKAGSTPAGTEANPMKYLVTEDALLYGSFFNALMDRTDSYAQIEVRSGNTTSGKLVSSWMIYSGELTERDPESAWSVINHESVDPGESDDDDDYVNDDDYYDDPGDWDPGYVPSAAERAQTLRDKEMEVKSLDLSLRKAQLELKRMQDQVKDGVVYAKKDGVVTIAGDPANPPQDGSAFLKVSAGTGICVKGNVSELMLDRVNVDGPLIATDLETGMMYDGKIISLDDYPSTDSSYYGGNPNCSYYGFLAYFAEASDIRPDAWLQLTLGDTSAETASVICIPKAYIRRDKDQTYVMKDDNGVLVRQKVRCGKTYSGEYTQVLEGINSEDLLAFPYGDGAKAGVRTKEAEGGY